MDGTKRCRIQFGLEARESARTVGVSLTTVTREICKHTYGSFKGCYGRANQCVQRQDCRPALACRDCTAKEARCAAHKRKSLAKEYQHKVETDCYVGRTYADCQKFLAGHPGVEAPQPAATPPAMRHRTATCSTWTE